MTDAEMLNLMRDKAAGVTEAEVETLKSDMKEIKVAVMQIQTQLAAWGMAQKIAFWIAGAVLPIVGWFIHDVTVNFNPPSHHP